MSKQKTATEMFPLVSEWETSHETQLQFCESRDIRPSVFSYWRKKYLEDQSSSTRACFTEILPEVNENIEVCYPNGVQIKLPASSSSLTALQALIRLG